MRLCGVPQQEVQSSMYTLVDYPDIFVAVDRLNTSSLGDYSLGSSHSWQNVIVPVEETVCKKIVRTFFENGFRDALNEACAAESVPVVCSIAQHINKLVTYVDRMKSRVFKSISHKGIAALADFSETRDWLRSPIRYIAWHPNCFKLAIAGSDDQVRIYTKEYPPIILKNGSQKCITSMAWRPFSAGELAVGCSKGVFIWPIDVANQIMRATSNFVTLRNPDFVPVSSIQWNVDGTLLAVASIANSNVLLWSYDKRESVLLRRIKFPCTLLKWSMDNSSLLTTSTSNYFRVWCTEKKWTPERWSIPQGYVQSACWSACSSVLLFVSSQDSLLYSLHFYEEQMFTGESSQVATPIADLSKCEMNGTEVGGQPQALAWDPNGTYLAIIFKDSPCVVIYTTYLQRFNCNITPNFYIIGYNDEYPSFICFQPKNRFNSDSILTIGWSSGRIQYFPFSNM